MTEHSDPSEDPVVDDGRRTTLLTRLWRAVGQAALDAYDLDDDGRISLTENVRAELGMLDAHAGEMAEESGLKGKVGRPPTGCSTSSTTTELTDGSGTERQTYS